MICGQCGTSVPISSSVYAYCTRCEEIRQKKVKELATLRKLIAQHFHHPDDARCGVCDGLLEFTRDAICLRCSPEPEVVALQDERDKLRSLLLAAYAEGEHEAGPGPFTEEALKKAAEKRLVEKMGG